MLRFSKMADYATLVMVVLAQANDTLLNAREVALRSHLSVPTVSKLLKKLAVGELVASIRGSKGGYRLKADPAAIQIAQILDVIDGQTGLTACSLHNGVCEIETRCQVRMHWRLINDTIMGALQQLSLAQLAFPTAQPVADQLSHWQMGGYQPMIQSRKTQVI